MWDSQRSSGLGNSADPGIGRARMLHLAEGVLVALRRCTPEAALAELVDAARASHLSPYAVACGLVSLAAGDISGDDVPEVVKLRWSELLASDGSVRLPQGLTQEYRPDDGGFAPAV